MELIRVRDFAKECNCTPQNLYKHIRNYAEDLEGHVYDSKKGKLLDVAACEFLRSVMYPKELSPNNDKLIAELNEMRAALLKLGQDNLNLASRLATAEGERDRALFDNGHDQKLLKAADEEKEAREAEIQDLKEKERAAQDEAAALRKENEELIQQNAAMAKAKYRAESEVIILKKRNWWQRLARKGE